MWLTALIWAKANKRAVAAIALLAIIVVALTTVFLMGRSAERKQTEAAQAVAVAEALKTDGKAKEKAADTRLADATAVATMKEELTDAVADLPDEIPGARRVALACQRLRHQGADVSNVAACR